MPPRYCAKQRPGDPNHVDIYAAEDAAALLCAMHVHQGFAERVVVSLNRLAHLSVDAILDHGRHVDDEASHEHDLQCALRSSYERRRFLEERVAYLEQRVKDLESRGEGGQAVHR